ncbi:hypothetical protein K435DRAFT_861192 [Dendrothele bispora CBS 962.96]|uniref:Uncharacterized protein n=1 Tax=Dendrothele bispora (strain CBS 962.96) TaxID=1314807 RepID=A0A4S8LWG9_DENBC|nr:hypothetical protein K435DRAFT_861192 [Dendrothele bispora CBS 962.96]
MKKEGKEVDERAGRDRLLAGVCVVSAELWSEYRVGDDTVNLMTSCGEFLDVGDLGVRLDPGDRPRYWRTGEEAGFVGECFADGLSFPSILSNSNPNPIVSRHIVIIRPNKVPRQPQRLALSRLHHFSKTHLALRSLCSISRRRRYYYKLSEQQPKYQVVGHNFRCLSLRSPNLGLLSPGSQTTSSMKQRLHHHHHHHQNVNMGTHFGQPSPLGLNPFVQHTGTGASVPMPSNKRSAAMASLDEDA